MAYHIIIYLYIPLLYIMNGLLYTNSGRRTIFIYLSDSQHFTLLAAALYLATRTRNFIKFVCVAMLGNKISFAHQYMELVMVSGARHSNRFQNRSRRQR